MENRDAFGAFYRMHALTVYRWFVVHVERDRGTASELTAETFAEALRSLPRFRGRAPGDGTAWLFGIARNLAREQLPRSGRRRPRNHRRRPARPVPAPARERVTQHARAAYNTMMRSSVLALAAVVATTGGSASAAAVQPKQAVTQAKREWLREVREAARVGDDARSFPSPSRAILLKRLLKAQQRYGFGIVSVRMLRPLQLAPVIVIRSDRKLETARAIPAIVKLFDPRRTTKTNPSGFAYEAYFLEAQTRKGVPYLATFNFSRPPNVGGGEWAAEERLYPFPHL